jgi:chemotaxis signal transduction protein
MNAPMPGVLDRLDKMRLDFDRAFAELPLAEAAARDDLLAIRLSERSFAIRLSEIAGLFADKKITRVPGGNAALLGIAGFRGSIVPVYDLQCLIGLSSSITPRWLVIAAAAPVAFAFDVFEGQLRVSPAAIVPRQSRAEMTSFARDHVQTDQIIRPILHLRAVLDAIKV